MFPTITVTMKYSFEIKGHSNILSKHSSTIEFTKSKELSKGGDCIVGVEADFELKELRKFSEAEKVKIKIENKGGSFSITAEPNKEFNDNEEMVIRISDFVSERTFAIRADKASKDIPKEIIEALQKEEKATITIED